MKTYQIPGIDLPVSRLSYGCMRLGGSWGDDPLTTEDRKRAVKSVAAALERGINIFDHADIYMRGKSETVFAEALQDLAVDREQIVLQSKCGIRFPGDPSPHSPGRYDFSYEHIIASVEGILRRLETEYLDILLLHRPDPLVEPEEVARAFDELHRSGKVRAFGVSNHTGAQIALLQAFVDQPLVVNQLEVNLLHSYLIDDGVLANQREAVYVNASGTLDYCRLHGILVQAWSPVAQGALTNPPHDAPDNVLAAAELVAQFAAEKETTGAAIVLAWLLRHPAGIQPVLGTTNTQRIADSCLADDVTLSREEWYRLFIAARGGRLP
ncbi:MAG TPA: aldo/keto reductase [Anaerolineae bacterium]|nr:aldo/keto reductase [Anaerolineae bacterium]